MKRVILPVIILATVAVEADAQRRTARRQVISAETTHNAREAQSYQAPGTVDFQIYKVEGQAATVAGHEATPINGGYAALGKVRTVPPPPPQVPEAMLNPKGLDQTKIFRWHTGQSATPTGHEATPVGGGYASLKRN